MRNCNFVLVLSILTVGNVAHACDLTLDTLPALSDAGAPDNFDEMWTGFDPRAEPLEVETLAEWEDDDVVLRIVRFRIGIFKGEKATLAAIYGFPKSGTDLPGLLQIHGGGQYADHKACLTNAKRGYATLSIAWAGRISAPTYRVDPAVVRLFWDGRTDDPAYRLTTDWGAVDGYHAPGRNPGNAFPSVRPAEWTLDDVESPRNSGWFLCALAARRGLTFLERQTEVDPDRLGVYGHSMGGKLTVLAGIDSRVKAAAPSCGGISDRDNDSPLFRSTLGDDVSLRELSCPIIFLSPANDFHGRIGDLPDAVEEIASDQWRVTCSPHHNHQDTPEFEVATQLWFDQHLQGTFQFPESPETTIDFAKADGVPSLTVHPDASMQILSVDVYYTQQGKPVETPQDRENTLHRFWHHAPTTESNGRWVASVPIASTDKPLWAYANIRYALPTPVTGAGYYYGIYNATSFNLSSLLMMVSPEELDETSAQATLQPTSLIEDFVGEWHKEWFTYKPDEWARSTHKLYDETFQPPEHAILQLGVRAVERNELVLLIDDHAAIIPLEAENVWQEINLSPHDFQNLAGESLTSWDDVKRLTLAPTARLNPTRGDTREPRNIGQRWQGASPSFGNLRWHVKSSESD